MRSLGFLAIFFLFWITTTPFVDLRNPDVLLASESGSGLEQICVVAAFVLAACVLARNKEAAWAVVSPALVCVLAWQLVTVLTSTHLDISIRRFVLSVMVIAICAATPLLPRDVSHFSRLLAIGGIAVLLLAYFGVFFFPDISIHNLAEVLELDNAGAWRGHFAHKNIAGAAMVILIVYGCFVGRKQGVIWGAPIVVLAAIFLYKSDNKTSIALVAAAFVLAGRLLRTRSLWLKACVALLPVGAMLLFTVGSVLFAPIGALVAAVSSDPTFTHRTDIWRFALDNLFQRPVFGYGFEAFWKTSNLVNGGETIETWASGAGHAHDGYLNVALTTGLPGLLLVAYWLLWEPLRNFHESQTSGNDPDLAAMYLRVWIFGLLYACLESPFFDDRGPIWFSILGAVVGLRLHARAVHVTASASPRQDAPVFQQP